MVLMRTVVVAVGGAVCVMLTLTPLAASKALQTPVHVTSTLSPWRRCVS